MTCIKFYKSVEPYGYLNNFTAARMFVYGRWWATVEHAYQAQKTENEKEYDEIWKAKTPAEARKLGQKVHLHPNWENSKDWVMEQCVLAKFVQHHDLREKLLSTGEAEIVEDSPIDSYWGCGTDGAGKNMLGKILMKVREKLRE